MLSFWCQTTLIETELNTKEIKFESAFSVYLCQNWESHPKILVNTVFWRMRVVPDNTRRRCNSLVLGTVAFFFYFNRSCLQSYMFTWLWNLFRDDVKVQCCIHTSKLLKNQQLLIIYQVIVHAIVCWLLRNFCRYDHFITSVRYATNVLTRIRVSLSKTHNFTRINRQTKNLRRHINKLPWIVISYTKIGLIMFYFKCILT